MNRFNRILTLMQENLKPLHLVLENESSQHSVPPGSESHFKVLVVSEIFERLSRVARQRLIYSQLDQEFKSGLHALTIRALTAEEWEKQNPEGFVSPGCHGSRAKPSNS